MTRKRGIVWIFLPLLVLFPAVARAAGGGGEGGLDLVSGIALAIVAACVLMVLFNALRLPALLAYIVSGLVVAAVAAPILGDSIHIMEHISHLGLVFLLFIIGLEMDLRGILRLGPRTALAVLLQAPIAIAAVLGMQYAASALGLSIPGLGTNSPSFFFFAVACALGSTAVVVKLLGDKFDLDSQAGKITVLTLIAEDIFAVLALSYVASLGGGKSASLALMLGGGAAVAIALVVFSRYALSRIMASLAKSPDLMAFTAIGWCFLSSQAMSRVGLSAEMGALIAGLTVGALPNHVEVLAKVSSLRDFFMALFFVALGMTLPPPTLEVMLHAGALVLIVIIVRMVLFAPTLLFARQGPVVSLTAPINLSQVSEFTLLLVPIGIGAGALSVRDGSVISYGLMISVVISSFAIANNYRLATFLGRILPSRLQGPSVDAHAGKKIVAGVAGADGHALSHDVGHGGGRDIVMLGYFQNTEALAMELKRTDPDLIQRILVLDFNLKKHADIRAHGFQVAYADISNPESLRHHGLAHAKVVLSTISNTFLRGTSNQELADRVKSMNPHARFIATADDEKTVALFAERGIFRTVTPPVQAAPAFARALRQALQEDEPDNKA